MLSLQYIREHEQLVRDGIANKGEQAPLDELLLLDDKRRRLQAEVDSLRQQRKEGSKTFPKLADRAQKDELRATMESLAQREKELKPELDALEKELQQLLLLVPNIPHPSAPIGKDETQNIEISRWGEPRSFDFKPLPHWEIGEKLNILDFERGVKISGTRFFIFRGLGARLERALINFMVDLHTNEHGYTEVATPFLVKRECMLGTGQLPKFEDDAYRIESDDLFLNPTAEVPVTNQYREEILEPGSLPIKNVAYCPSFRREAGSAGRDTRGMIRVHQFDKVEMVKFVEPATSYAELQAMLGDAEDVLRRLELPYHVLEMCTGDMGFTQTKKYDPEVWMPAQNRYVEISSVSNCEAFQARRANIKYRPEPGARAGFVHTLNGSGLAVGRTFAAILENYQQADGSVLVPQVLQPYLGGLEVIR